MNKDIIDIKLPAESPDEDIRECHMSQELFQNASRTMGELRDFMRETGVSWDVLQQNIERARPPHSAIEKALARMDDYSTGIGRSLYDKQSNIH